MTWDKKKKRFIQGDGVGADNVKLVTTESGAKLPATYRSGRFDEWKAKARVNLPKIGEAENEATHVQKPGGHRFKHNKTTAAKPLDKLNHDYERKVRQLKKREEESGGGESSNQPFTARGGRGGAARGGARGGSRGKPGGRYGGKPMGRVKSEIKNAEQIRKDRKVLERKKEKNARPSRGSKRGRR